MLWTLSRPVGLPSFHGLQCISHPCSIWAAPSVSPSSCVRRGTWCHDTRWKHSFSAWARISMKNFSCTRSCASKTSGHSSGQNSPTCRCCKAWGSCRLLPPFQEEWLIWKRRLGSSFSHGGQGQKAESQEVTCALPCNGCEALCQQLGQRRAHTLLRIQHIPNNFVILYMDLLLGLPQTRTSSGWRARSSPQTGKSELGATRPS